MTKTYKKNRGFTLIEMIVSLGLLITVLTVAMGALASMGDTNRKVQSSRVALDNLNIAIEDMSRNIRTGTIYVCKPIFSLTLISGVGSGKDCLSGEESLAFLSSGGNTVGYKLENGQLMRSRDGGDKFSAMTSPEITVDTLTFYVIGAEAGNAQPRVIITIGGVAGPKEGTTSSFQIQTTVTQRIPK